MATATRQRARSMDEFRTGQQKFVTAARAAYAAAPLCPLPTDVIISPYGKCGTTMLQQAFHTLRTGGDMDFDDVSRVVPWIEMAPILGIDLNAPQRAEPRGFKSHLSYTLVPKGARYVVPLRDPKDAFVSMYRFMEGWFLEPGTVPMEDFFEGWASGGGPEGEGYFSHLLSWWAVREQPDVLLFTYANMVRDPAGHLRRLAAFAGIPLDDALLELALERTSRVYMLANKDRFDDAMMRELSETKGGLPPGSDSAKVRAGSEAGNHRDELPHALAERIDDLWAEKVAAPLGFANFAALEAELYRSA
ncbi:sulfotransferase domain-containing protein [Sphingomonas hankyongi]|uniref:Sulfotransferase domain-containing protein n=1 Tax=Sphingomonas hankyongi TaxID=2908209 RepID=A0ABT0RZN5_9SPHN|nr:sulfotransferase domain-containing protein [Sphingomonas hankyongi]MCL6729059.1 sulfotransferase domain-containing protein [Sphingomonas hankyongi]